MDRMAVAEEQILLERVRRKIEEVNASGQSQLSPIQEHISFTLLVYIYIYIFLQSFSTSIAISFNKLGQKS